MKIGPLRKALRRRFRMLFGARRKVDFIICGAQKGGTSSLNSYLRGHPEICMAEVKEIHFFDRDEHFPGTAAPDYSWYQAWFRPRRSHRLLGEATPSYLYRMASPRRMWEYNPRLKLVALLRNPVKRAYSQWNMQRMKNPAMPPFWEALQRERELFLADPAQQHPAYSFVARGRYLDQLRRLWEYFPRDQVLVLKSEHLLKRPGDELARVCDFLGVSRFTSITPLVQHARPYSSDMDDRERAYLRSIFDPEIDALESELGWDCADWRVA